MKTWSGRKFLRVIQRDETILSQWSGTEEGWFIGNAQRTGIDTSGVHPPAKGEESISQARHGVVFRCSGPAQCAQVTGNICSVEPE